MSWHKKFNTPSRLRINKYAYLCVLMMIACLFLTYVTNDFKDYIIPLDGHRLKSKGLFGRFEKEKDYDKYLTTKSPKMVLIVTLWRSGSSWLGQLVSRAPNSFYLYEPVHMLISDTTNDLGLNIVESDKVATIKKLLHCGINTDFMEHYKNWTEIYPKRYCSASAKECPPLNITEVTEECLTANFRTIKTVRLTIESVEEFFLLPSFRNLKVIFLVRDPRGTLNSMISIGKEKKIWNVTALEMCARIRNNMWMFRTLKSIYPNRLYFLRYEDIAMDPFGKAADLWNFLHDNDPPPLPTEWEDFLKESQSSKNYTIAKQNPFAINKRSTQDWQQWRNDVTEQIFNDTQYDCKDVINVLGYRYFDSLSEMRNSSLPAISAGNCVSIPCLGNT